MKHVFDCKVSICRSAFRDVISAASEARADAPSGRCYCKCQKSMEEELGVCLFCPIELLLAPDRCNVLVRPLCSTRIEHEVRSSTVEKRIMLRAFGELSPRMHSAGKDFGRCDGCCLSQRRRAGKPWCNHGFGLGEPFQRIIALLPVKNLRIGRRIFGIQPRKN